MCGLCWGKGVRPTFGAPAHTSQFQLRFIVVLASVYLQRLLGSPAGLKLEIGGDVGCPPEPVETAISWQERQAVGPGLL